MKSHRMMHAASVWRPTAAHLVPPPRVSHDTARMRLRIRTLSSFSWLLLIACAHKSRMRRLPVANTDLHSCFIHLYSLLYSIVTQPLTLTLILSPPLPSIFLACSCFLSISHYFSPTLLLSYTTSLLHYFSLALLLSYTTSLLHYLSFTLLVSCTTCLLHYFSPTLLLSYTTCLLHYLSLALLLSYTTSLLHYLSLTLLVSCTTSLLHYFSLTLLVSYTTCLLH